jgi:hypothetical protein
METSSVPEHQDVRCPAVDPAATVSALNNEAMFLQIKSSPVANVGNHFTRVAVITGTLAV